MSPSVGVVLSCEHAGNEFPESYARYFVSAAAKEALGSHRGWDPGSLLIGEAMAEVLSVPLHVQPVTRLLVECNRSLEHPRLFSEFSRRMTADERVEVLERYWRRHRESVRERVRGAGSRTVIHIGIHTFTPTWNGKMRDTDIGLLFDPARTSEARLVRRWRAELLGQGAPAACVGDDGNGSPRIHLNRPYRGWTDGLTTTLRSDFPATRYVGLELEVSQALAARGAPALGRWLATTLRSVLVGLR